jgi:hypothetical protein
LPRAMILAQASRSASLTRDSHRDFSVEPALARTHAPFQHPAARPVAHRAANRVAAAEGPS